MQLNVAQQSVKIASLKDEIAKAKEQIASLNNKLMQSTVEKAKIQHQTPKPRRKKRNLESPQKPSAAVNRSQSVE